MQGFAGAVVCIFCTIREILILPHESARNGTQIYKADRLKPELQNDTLYARVSGTGRLYTRFWARLPRRRGNSLRFPLVPLRSLRFPYILSKDFLTCLTWD